VIQCVHDDVEFVASASYASLRRVVGMLFRESVPNRWVTVFGLRGTGVKRRGHFWSSSGLGCS